MGSAGGRADLVQPIDPVSSGSDGFLEVLQVTLPWHWLFFVVAGAVAIIAGGFCAAIDGADPSQHLSWASAYLVLVWGSAQILLGGGQALFDHVRPRRRFVASQFLSFNSANAAVLVGTLSGLSVLLDAGSALFLLALLLFAWASKGSPSRHRLTAVAYRITLLVLGVSVPIGVMLAR